MRISDWSSDVCSSDLNDLDTRLAELRRDALDAGLTTMVYRGKLAAGCRMSEIVRMAMDAGIATEAFCRSPGADGEGETRAHSVGCPAIVQRAEIARSHVVSMPPAFMSLNVPAAIKPARPVIADQRLNPHVGNAWGRERVCQSG